MASKTIFVGNFFERFHKKSHFGKFFKPNLSFFIVFGWKNSNKLSDITESFKAFLLAVKLSLHVIAFKIFDFEFCDIKQRSIVIQNTMVHSWINTVKNNKTRWWIEYAYPSRSLYLTTRYRQMVATMRTSMTADRPTIHLLALWAQKLCSSFGYPATLSTGNSPNNSEKPTNPKLICCTQTSLIHKSTYFGC